MTGIGSNIVGSVAASQVSASETNKKSAAQRNKQASDARQLARLADHQKYEVEDTDQTENVRVYKEDERQRDNPEEEPETPTPSESDVPEDSAQTYTPKGRPTDTPPPDTTDHIDFSA